MVEMGDSSKRAQEDGLDLGMLARSVLSDCKHSPTPYWESHEGTDRKIAAGLEAAKLGSAESADMIRTSVLAPREWTE